MNILIGCDPEVFMKNPNSGEFVSAHGHIPGTKYQPHQVANGAVQVDGMALEFNTTPAENARDFVVNVKSVFDQLKKMVPGYNVVIEPTAIFNQQVFDAAPDVAKELGCEPDFNAWTGGMNERPENNRPMRTASGHIHIGWGSGFNVYGEEHWQECQEVVKQLDYYLGIYSLLWDPDPTRRQMYGKAGCFRPKSYGVEYRVMSNAWLRDDRLMAWVFEAAKRGTENYFAKKLETVLFGELAREIIDSGLTSWPTRYPELFNRRVVPPLPKSAMVA